MSGSGEYLLEVKKLTIDFRTASGVLRAVNDVSFSIKPGESVGIVGESGSGKTVTALSILGLLPPSITRIPEHTQVLFQSDQFGRVDLRRLSYRDLRKIRGKEISIIFQEPMTSLNPVFRCGDQVAEVILTHEDVSKQEAKERVIYLFQRVGLKDPERIYRAYPHQLSGGQKQRVMIAMALACSPKLVIADEPTTALDVTVQKKVLELLRELQEEYHMALIFISHDLGVISEIADRVLVMYRGQLVEDNDIHTIFHNPEHPYTRGLIACRPPMDVKLRRLPTLSDFMEVTPEGEVIPKQTDKSIDEILQELAVSESEIQSRLEKLMAQEPLLKVQNLKVYFPARKNLWGKPVEWVKAVDDVSFEVYPGETLGLVGESGSGKTTLSRAILRLIEPTAGKVIYKGVDLLELEGEKLRALRKDLQIIFQDPYSSLNPRMTVGYAIEEPMRIHGICKSDDECRKKAMELLEAVQLKPEHYYRYPHEFSGGQRQRICIARALAVQPKFIICDEAVSSLDVSVQAEILNLLNQLKEEFNLTYIFISHDISVVKFMSDRIMVMYMGKIMEIGPAEEVINNPKAEYTRTLIESVPKGERLFARP